MSIVEKIKQKDAEKRELWEQEIKKIVPNYCGIEKENNELSIWINENNEVREFFVYSLNSDKIYVRPLFNNLDLYKKIKENKQHDTLVILMRAFDRYIN